MRELVDIDILIDIIINIIIIDNNIITVMIIPIISTLLLQSAVVKFCSK